MAASASELRPVGCIPTRAAEHPGGQEDVGESQRAGMQPTKFYCLVERFCYHHPSLNGEANPTSQYIYI